MMDGPGAAGFEEGFGVGLPLVAPGPPPVYGKQSYELEIDDPLANDVKLNTVISVDCSPAREGSGFTPFFGVKWGVEILEKIKATAATTELLILDPDTVVVSFPPAQNPIAAARANGNMPRGMRRGWSEVP